MLNRTFIYTTLFSALFMAISLKFMELFSFIKWSPIGFLKNENFLPKLHFTIQWGIFYLILCVVFACLYIAFFFLASIPPSVPAILFSLLGVLLIEWFIDSARTPMETIQSLSIPFLSIVLITLRFISGTASFNKELSKKG